jgi:ubiquinol-cytochrome c reductase cytochrome b subunit
LFIVYFTRTHIRDWMPDRKSLLFTTWGLLLYALIVEPSLAVPPGAPVALVKGPWFFLGIQSLLKISPPLVGGLLIPALYVTFLLLLPLVRGRLGDGIHALLLVSSGLYGVLTLRGLIWAP